MNRRDFLCRTSLAALTAGVPPAVLSSVPVGMTGRVLTADQWRTLMLVQDHLLPSEPGAPGSQDIQATAYLDAVLADPELDPDTRAFVLRGIGWLDDLAREVAGYPFAEVGPGPREDLLRRISDTAAGDNWLSTLVAYTLEALLGDPLYGGNPGGIGWVWLDHDPGRPRPTPATLYGTLGKS